MKMKSGTEVQIYDVTVTPWERKDGSEQIIHIQWDANIGFGEYALVKNKETGKWTAKSECMDKQGEFEFLRLLFDKFLEEVEVVE